MIDDIFIDDDDDGEPGEPTEPFCPGRVYGVVEVCPLAGTHDCEWMCDAQEDYEDVDA